MKSFISIFLLLLPFLAQAQQNWTQVVPTTQNPRQLLVTKDGHFLVLDSKEDPWEIDAATEGPSLSKFTPNGSLVWQRRYLHPTNKLIGHSIFLMQDGNIWLTGEAHKPFANHRFMLSKINHVTGDTLYTKFYAADSIRYNQHTWFVGNAQFYLQPSPAGDRFFSVHAMADDVFDGTLHEITEHNELLSKPFEYIAQYPFEQVRPYGDKKSFPKLVTSSTGFAYFTHNFHSRIFLTSVNGTNLQKEFPLSYALAATAFPAGGLLLLNSSKAILLSPGLEQVAQVPYTAYAPVLPQEEPMHLEPTSDGFLVSGYYQPEGTSSKALFLMKLNLQGQLVWKRHYPEEAGTELIDMVAPEAGAAVLLLKNQNATRLVKTNGQGLTLHSQEAVSRHAFVFTLYPNPASGNNVALSFQKAFSGTLRIYDQTGRLQLEQELGKQSLHQLTLPASLPAGVYHLLLRDVKGASQSARFIKK